MTLRKMTLLVVGFTLLGLIAAVAIALEITLIKHFNSVENQSIAQDMQRVHSAIDSSVDNLEASAQGLAWRGDVYQHLAAPESSASPAIFENRVFETLGINLLLLLDQRGNLLDGSTFDPQRNGLEPLPPELTAQLGPGGMLAAAGRQEGVTGLLELSDTPLLIVFKPVRALDGAGPVVGALGVGRLLDENEVQRLGSVVRLPISIYPYTDNNLSPGFLSAKTVLLGDDDIYTSIADEEVIAAYSLLSDLSGQPAFILNVEQPRTIYRNGRVIMNSLVWVLVVAVAIFGAVIIFALEKMVLSRLFRLNAEVSLIGETGELDRRVGQSYNDELTNLSRGINYTLDRLEALQVDEHRRVSELDALFGASQDFLAQTGKAAVLSSACRLAVDQFGLDAAWAGLLDSDGLIVTPAAACGLAVEQVEPVRLTWGDPLPSSAVVEALATMTMAIQKPDADPGLPAQSTDRYRSEAALPLVIEEEAAGVICLLSWQEMFFTSQNRQWLSSFGNLVGMAYQNARLVEQLIAGRQRLQALSRRLVEVQEEERRQIALELHDEVGQILTGLKLLLDSGSAAGYTLEWRQQTLDLVNDLIGRVRQMSLDLRPAMLDDLGLLPALLWLSGRYTSQTCIQVHLQHHEIENRRFPTEYETTAYRVIQEGLTNAARYASVNEVFVRLWNNDGKIGIQVEDHGVGFVPESVLSGGNSRGLVGMRERATSLGGRLTIVSTPGQGTCLTVELPLNGFLERRRNAR